MLRALLSCLPNSKITPVTWPKSQMTTSSQNLNFARIHQWRGEYFFQKPIFLHMPKNGPARVPRKAWFLDSNISARSPKKAIFLHIVVIFLHGLPQKVFCAQLKRTSLNLQCITLFCFLYHDIRDHLSPLFPLTVLRVTVPDQYFCTKHPNLNITAR